MYDFIQNHVAVLYIAGIVLMYTLIAVTANQKGS